MGGTVPFAEGLQKSRNFMLLLSLLANHPVSTPRTTTTGPLNGLEFPYSKTWTGHLRSQGSVDGGDERPRNLEKACQKRDTWGKPAHGPIRRGVPHFLNEKACLNKPPLFSTKKSPATKAMETK